MKKIDSLKQFVARNKTKILITTTVIATAAAVAFRKGLNDHDEFLKKHDLYNEYYSIED